MLDLLTGISFLREGSGNTGAHSALPRRLSDRTGKQREPERVIGVSVRHTSGALRHPREQRWRRHFTISWKNVGAQGKNPIVKK